MNAASRPKAHRTRLGLWAPLTLAALVAGAGAMAADAQGTHGKANSKKQKFQCSYAGACLEWDNTQAGTGVEGNSINGIGVDGYSQTYYALYGIAQGTYGAIGGFNVNSGPGVYGQSISGPGLTGYSTSSYAMMAQGSIYATGEIYTGGSCHNGCSKTRQQAAFVSRTSQPTIDDVGEATLHLGVAHVALAPDFANTIDTRKPYVVLVTPEGAASLYVTNRTAGGFDVRALGDNHSSIPFAYRIVAKPLGSSNERLPFKAVTDYSAQAQPHR